MRRMGAFLLALLFCALSAAPARAAGETAPPAVTADAYIVMDAATGQILIEKNSARRSYPASITKIMTMALAMERCGGDVSQQTTVSYAAVHALEYGSSHVALQPDEVVTLRDLFHATVLASANDAANVLAEYTAGSMDAFAAQMNEKAAALGMAGTHFVNASGLHDDAHYTTARDMAVLTRWAMTVPGFAELFGATEYVMPPTNKQEQERRWGTDNCMLVTNKYQYDGTIGGKSGWTHEAGYTMVEAVRRGDVTLLCVVLGCDKKYDKFSDSIALLDYCFDNFVPAALSAGDLEMPEVPVYYDANAPSVGLAPLSPPEGGCAFLLHRALGAGDIQAIFDAPEAYYTEQPFAATMTLALRDGLAADGCMYAQLGQYAVGVDAGAVERLLNANAKEFVDRPEAGQAAVRVGLALLGVLLALVILAALRIAYVAYVKARRRKRRRARQSAPRRQAPASRPRISPARRRAGPERADAERTIFELAALERTASGRKAAGQTAFARDVSGRECSGQTRDQPAPAGRAFRQAAVPAMAASSPAAPEYAPPAKRAAPAAPVRGTGGARHAVKLFQRRKAPPPRHARH